MTSTASTHWREYAIEAVLLGAFMISAAAWATLLYHPASPWFVGAGATVAERVPMALAMGVTAVALIYSPWGARSGAHMNPAVTLTFWRLKKITGIDAAGYIAAHVAGGSLGIVLATLLLAQLPADPAINYIATLPGPTGAGVALLAEFAISCGLMAVVLGVASDARLAPYAGAAAGLLVAAYITFEAPLSGMSMNPARSLGPALLAGRVETMWIYTLGPLAGMQCGALIFCRLKGLAAVRCAKLHHPSHVPCIHCGSPAAAAAAPRRGDEVPA